MKTKAILIALLLTTTVTYAQLPSECLATEEKLYVQALITENESDLDIKELDLKSCNDDEVMSGLRKARLYRENGQRIEAEGFLVNLLELEDLTNDQSAEINFMMGELHFAAGRIEDALQSYHSAENLGKPEWYTQFEIARCYISMNEYKKGLKVLHSYLKKYPKNKSAHYNLGLCYERLSIFENALKEYKTAFQLSDFKDPNYAYSALNIMVITNQVKEGIAFGLKAIENGPQNEDLWHEVAYFYNKLGDHKEAVVFSERMVNHFPESNRAYFRLAYSHGEQGRVKDALKYYFMALKYKPDDQWAMHNIGIHYREIGLFEKSHKYADMAIAIDPRREFYVTKINAYQWAHELKEYLDLCIWIDEEFDPVGDWELEMGYAHMVNESYKEAINWHVRYILKFPDDSRAHNNIARCYDKSGEYKMAEHHYSEALRCNNENSFVYHNMASMYADLGNADLACEYLATALEKEYNWVIDEKLVMIHNEHCPEISLDRTVLLHGYKGNLTDYEGQSFIEIRELDEAFQEQILQEEEEPKETKVIATKDNRFQLYRVYPNPSQDRFFIEPNTDSEFTSSTTVKVFDMNSKLVLQQALVNGTKEMIDLSSQPSGTYILLISDEEKVLFNQRLMVQR